MDEYERHRKNWKYLHAFFHAFIPPLFNMTYEPIEVEGPILLVPNHVTAWDPLLVAMSLKNKQIYYVASEHLFRLGKATDLLNHLVAPIPRRKGTTGADTAKIMLRHLKGGRSVCVFAEGAQTFDGRTVYWNWPGFLDANGTNYPGINIIEAGHTLGELFAGCPATFKRDERSRRSTVTLVKS